MEGKIRRSSIGYAIALLFVGSVIGPIIYGAVTALFWSNAADTDDAQKAAHRLYRLTEVNPGPWIIRSHIKDSLCNSKAMDRFTSGFGTDEDRIHIYAATVYSENILHSHYEERGENVLYKLSPPVLGGLETCIRATVLAPFCRSYVTNKVERAVKVDKKTEQKWLAEMDFFRNAALCASERTSTVPESKRAPEAPRSIR